MQMAAKCDGRYVDTCSMALTLHSFSSSLTQASKQAKQASKQSKQASKASKQAKQAKQAHFKTGVTCLTCRHAPHVVSDSAAHALLCRHKLCLLLMHGQLVLLGCSHGQLLQSLQRSDALGSCLILTLHPAAHAAKCDDIV